MSSSLVKIGGSKVLRLSNNGMAMNILKNTFYGKAKIGKREVVGFGMTGEYSYFDRMDFPYPAIRFQEYKDDLVAIREKEKGDWKKLTPQEVKKLYRTSFCRTFAECEAPTGEWKTIIGNSLLVFSTALWVFILMKKYVYGPLPESTTEEWKQKQLEWYVKIRVDPIDGLGSKWDYEKDQWKE